MMTTLLPSLQKICSFNLNSLFTTSNGSSLTSAATATVPDKSEAALKSQKNFADADGNFTNRSTDLVFEPSKDQQDISAGAVVCKQFYWSNLVLDTNHTNSSNSVTTRAQAKFRKLNHGKLVASSTPTPNIPAASQTQTQPGSKFLNLAGPSPSGPKMGAIKILGCNCNGLNKNRKNRNSASNSEKGFEDQNSSGAGRKSESCKCFVISGNNNNNVAESDCTSSNGSNCGGDGIKKKTYCFHEAPYYLRFNPHITGGYRGMLRPVECIKSLFWWTNETMNIWTHLVGWFFFLALSIYDFLGLLDLPNIQPLDQMILTALLLCFQACMLLSSLYHIFCCHSEVSYRRWLSADLLGVSLSLLAIYVSGIYYAFSCVPFWLNFYLVTVGAIFATAMFMQIIPIVSKKELVAEERFRNKRLIVFGGWAAYGVIPTMHWAYLHGMAGPAVSLLLPRIFGVYIISAAAFFFYVTRIPEKFWPGLVNYIGSSHQIWHILIVAALYHWHNTGMLYLQFRAAHPCSEEYEYLFGPVVEGVVLE